MRNATLGELKATLRAELRQSANPAVAQSADHILVNAIKQAQGWVHTQHWWPHMRARRDIALEAGSYQYDWPADMDYENVERILTKYGDRWQPVTLFTDDDDTYNAFDTDEDVRADPVLEYRILSDTQLEVWPIPLTAGKIRIKGLLRPPELNAETVRCPFDDQIITKVAAARLSKDEGEAARLEKSAISMMEASKTRASTATSFHIGGAHSRPTAKRELVVRVVRE